MRLALTRLRQEPLRLVEQVVPFALVLHGKRESDGLPGGDAQLVMGQRSVHDPSMRQRRDSFGEPLKAVSVRLKFRQLRFHVDPHIGCRCSVG